MAKGTVRLTLEFEVEEYPTLDGYRRLLEEVETKAMTCIDIIEEETTIDVLKELGRR